MRQPGRGVVLVALAAAVAFAVAAGCQSVTVTKVRRRAPAPEPRGAVSPGTASTIPAPGAGGGLVRALASYQAGLAAEGTSSEAAADHYLDAVARAWVVLAALDPAGPGRASDPHSLGARDLYNEALARFLRVSSGGRVRLGRAWRDGLAARGRRVTVLLREGDVWEPDRFDEFLFPSDYNVRGLDHWYVADGLGVPLIALKRFRLKDLEGRRGQEKFLMPRQVYPVTAFMRVVPPPPDRPDLGPEFRLELRDTLRSQVAEFGGRPVPMAVDLTSPLAYHFAHSPLPLLQEVGLLDPQWLEKLQGLYMLHPYEPGKIPVVFVHGLRSSPAAWMKVINDLRGDPRLRERYQFWLFMYPTGMPFPLSAARLRQGLDELRQTVDPGRSDRALDQTVLVGHSMGGLISKMTVQESGGRVWRLISTRPFEQLRASPERREMLRRVFFFHPHPSVRRVIFVATPHRGSEMGDQFVGRLADRLIRMPGALRSTYRALLAQNGPEFFTPAIRSGLPSSIDELRRDNPLLMTLSDLPVGPGVACHSIIGRKDAGTPLKDASDGVVPYASAHLDWAESECVVSGDHGCQDGPETIREIRRILYTHLDQVARAGGAGRSTGKVGHAIACRVGGTQ